MLARGDLAFYNRDPRHRLAWTMYLILQAVGPNDLGKPTLLIQAINRNHSFKPRLTLIAPMRVLASEVEPISAYGVRVAQLITRAGGHHCNIVGLERFAPPEEGKLWGNRFGNDPYTDMRSVIDDDELAELLAETIAKRKAA